MKLPASFRATAVALLATLAACGAPSDEARIRGLLKEAAARAEKRNVADLMELFTPDYRDDSGRDRAATARLVQDYLDRYRGVVVHVLGARVAEVGDDGTAAVECEVVVSHGAAEVLRKLIRFTGDYYRFRIEVRRTGTSDWGFASAEWESIGLEELFPESLKLLKELFPGL